MENTFDSRTFGILTASFGIPVLILFVAWVVVLHFALNWQPILYLRHVVSNWLKSPPHAFNVVLFMVLFWVLTALPFVGTIAYGITVCLMIKPVVLGVVLAIAPCAIMLLLFSYQNYHMNGYSMTLLFKICAPISFILIFGCTILNTVLLSPVSWMGAGFTLLWPSLFIFAALLALSHQSLGKKSLGVALESQENMDSFSNNMAQKHFENWFVGHPKMPWYYTLVVACVSIISNGGFILLFKNREEKQATFHTAGASFLIDILMVIAQYTLPEQAQMFTYLFIAYLVKTVAVLFSSRFWFSGHGVIYFVIGTYFLTTFARAIWRRIAFKRDQGAQNDEILQNFEQLDPYRKIVPFHEIIMSGVCWSILTLALLLETFLVYSKSTFEELPFGLSQMELVIGCFTMCACFSIVIVSCLSFRDDGPNILNLVTFIIPNLVVLLVSILWNGLDDIKGLHAILFPFFFLIFSIFGCFMMLKKTQMIIQQTEGNMMQNFIHGKLNFTEYSLTIMALLAVIDAVAIAVVPFFFFGKKVQFVGLIIVFAVITLGGFISFCFSYITKKAMNLANWILLIVTVAGLAGLCGSFVPFGITWYILAAAFLVVAAIMCIIIAIVMTFLNRWVLEVKELVMICVPSGILAFFSCAVLVKFEIDVFSSILCLVFFFAFFGAILFYLLQKENWLFTWRSWTTIAALVVCFLGVLGWVIYDIGEVFVVLTVLLSIVFICSFFSMLGILVSRTTTETVVFSNLFFPVRLYARGELHTISAFPYMFCFSFLAPWIWGLIASVFFYMPQFGPLATSLALVLVLMLAMSLVYQFDAKTIQSLQYIHDDVIKFAISKALKCNSIVIGLNVDMERGADVSYEDFCQYNEQTHKANNSRSMFISSVKAQLSISAEVAFLSTLEELYDYFKARNDVNCEFLKTRQTWDVADRLLIFSLLDQIHGLNRDKMSQQAEYLAFVQRQEEERARKLMDMMDGRVRDDSNPFAEMLVDLERSGQKKFVDPDFHPNKKIPEDKGNLKNCSFKRIDEEYSSKLLGQLTAMDIDQGALGDCYFIAAMTAVSKSPWIVEGLFADPKINTSGAACVYFYYFGQRVPVIIDTVLPFNTKLDKPLFARPHTKETPWWFSITEKAFAKLAGSYQAIDGGNSHIALHRLTGGWPTSFNFNDLETKEKIRSGELFDQILKWHREGHFLCAGSASGSDTHKSAENIVLGHAYTILRVELIDGHQLLQLRNAWGHVEWNGDWGDSSSLWTPKMKKLLDYVDADDGIFWMNFKDFTHQFLKIYGCISLPAKEWMKTEVDGSWEPGEKDGAAPTSRQIDALSLPQWLVRFNQPTTLRCSFEKAGCASPAWIYLANVRGRKLKLLLRGDEYQTEAMAKSSELISFEWRIEHVEQPWTLCFVRGKAAQKTLYHFTMYSDKPLELTPIIENNVQ